MPRYTYETPQTPKEILTELALYVERKWVTEEHAALVRDAILEGAAVDYFNGSVVGDPHFRVETPLSPVLEARWCAALEACDPSVWSFLRPIQLQTNNPNYKTPCWFLNA